MKLRHEVSNIYHQFFKNDFSGGGSASYLYDIGGASWSNKGYSQFISEVYKKNVVANRCISLISRSAASIGWYVVDKISKKL